MPSIDWNLTAWNETHAWNDDGDEWNGMAAHSGQPYGAWKQGLVDEVLRPDGLTGKDVLEIAPGHGRWTEHLVPVVRSLTLVDLSPRCIDFCRSKFADATNIHYIVNDGEHLTGVPPLSIDVIWSFDSFVHMEAPTLRSYLAEAHRVLRPGGSVILHHADKRDWSLRLVPLTRRAGVPGRVVQRLASQGRLRDSGNRGDVSRELVGRLALEEGLRVDWQRSAWGPAGRYTVDKYRDCITGLVKPPE